MWRTSSEVGEAPLGGVVDLQDQVAAFGTHVLLAKQALGAE